MSSGTNGCCSGWSVAKGWVGDASMKMQEKIKRTLAYVLPNRILRFGLFPWPRAHPDRRFVSATLDLVLLSLSYWHAQMVRLEEAGNEYCEEAASFVSRVANGGWTSYHSELSGFSAFCSHFHSSFTPSHCYEIRLVPTYSADFFSYPMGKEDLHNNIYESD